MTDSHTTETFKGITLVLLPDSPRFTVTAAGGPILSAGLVGGGLFENFADHFPELDTKDQDSLRASLEEVLRQHGPQELTLGSDGDANAAWTYRHTPVFSAAGQVQYILVAADRQAATVASSSPETNSDQTGREDQESELKKFRFLANHARDPFILVRPDGSFAYLNTKALEAWGYTAEEARHLRVPDVNPHYDAARVSVLFDRALQEDLPPLETQHLRKNGEVFPVELTLSSLVLDGNVHLFVVARDITERQKAEKELAESKERFDLVARATQDAIWDWNLSSNLVWWNEGFRAMFGYDKSEVEPTVDSWYNRLHPDDRERIVKSIHEVIDSGAQHWSGEYRFRSKRGGYAVVFDRGYVVHDAAGRPVRMLGAMQDITERKHTEERFRTLFNSISQLAWMADSSGWIYWYNDRFFEYSGGSLEEMQGWGWEKIHHPDHAEKVRVFVEAAWPKGEPWEITIPLRGRDGDYRWFLCRAYPVKDTDGTIVQWIGTNTDITTQKQAEAKLEERVKQRTLELESQKNLVDSILLHSSNGISLTRMIRNEQGQVTDARVVLANDAAVRYTGLPREVYLTRTAHELDPAMMKTEYGQMCMDTLETGRPSVSQYLLELTGRWLELTVSRMDADHLIHIFTDITAMKETQLQLERSVDELKRSNAYLEEFAYAASHDMKEPIRKVHYFSDRLKKELEENLSEGQKKLFEKLENATQRMASLIDDLLEYSQATRGVRDLEPINLNRKVQLVLEDLELEIQQKSARVTVAELPLIRGNRRQMQQLFQNLLSNALKYSKPGEAPVIEVKSTRVQGREVEDTFPIDDPGRNYHLIEVSDEGIGFPQEDADRIFHIFTRLHGRSEYRGTGVGLAIAQKVAENHGGFIRAESQPGQGSKFLVLLPSADETAGSKE